MSAENAPFFATIARSLGGAGALRLVIQPVMAIVLGIRLGLADAREHRGPFVVRLARERGHVIRRALADIVVPFAIACVIDGILQHYAIGRVRPFAAIVVALLLVWFPFALARGVTNRIATGARARRGAANF